MNKIVNVGLIFKNRVGIVSQVSKKIFENGGNITKSNMVKLGNHFAFDLTATYPKEYNISIFDNIDTSDLLIPIEDTYNTKIRLYSSDNPGIIHSTCEKLEGLNADITNLTSSVTPAPFSNGPLFSLEVEFNIDRSCSREIIKQTMTEVVNKYDCDIDIN
jgi:glycine cleavage system regulatory protein